MDFRKKEQLVHLSRSHGAHSPERGAGLCLDRNERTLPFSGETLQSIFRSLPADALGLYPDVESFYARLARFTGFARENLFITEGVAGAIKALLESVAFPGQNIVYPVPTFAMYPILGEMFGVQSRNVGYGHDDKLKLDELYGMIDQDTAFVFLPNPNAPLEGTVDLREIADLARHCRSRGTFLVLDEVYHLWGAPTAAPLLKEHDNLILMRSFSKAFGLPGIRLGYLVGPGNVVEYVSKTRGGFEANGLSMHVARYFMDHFELVEDNIRTVKDGLDHFKKLLAPLNLEVKAGAVSNFVFVDFGSPERARLVVSELARQKIYVRGGWPSPYDRGVSMTGSSRPVMERVARELAKICDVKITNS